VTSGIPLTSTSKMIGMAALAKLHDFWVMGFIVSNFAVQYVWQKLGLQYWVWELPATGIKDSPVCPAICI
jgi:hypothetical protein